MRVPAQWHPTVLNLLRQGFVTAPYDLKAASKFAELWQDRKEAGVVKDLLENDGATRVELKADCMIVATALASGVDRIISHDVGLKKFAGSSVEVRELPSAEEQIVLIDP